MHPINRIARKIQTSCHLSTGQKAVKFCWIPSHVGIPGKEQADALGRSTILSTTRQPRFSHIPATDNYHPPPWSAPYLHNRRWETALGRSRIVHTHLMHYYLMSHPDPPVCYPCNVLSVPHILLSAPALLKPLPSLFLACPLSLSTLQLVGHRDRIPRLFNWQPVLFPQTHNYPHLI